LTNSVSVDAAVASLEYSGLTINYLFPSFHSFIEGYTIAMETAAELFGTGLSELTYDDQLTVISMWHLVGVPGSYVSEYPQNLSPEFSEYVKVLKDLLLTLRISNESPRWPGSATSFSAVDGPPNHIPDTIGFGIPGS
jgi:hypothetical protein